MFDVFSSVLNYLESDTAQLSMVPLAFSFLQDFMISRFDKEHHCTMKKPPKEWYYVISSVAHILALSRDLLVSTDHYSEVLRLVDECPVIAAAQAALEKI